MAYPTDFYAVPMGSYVTITPPGGVNGAWAQDISNDGIIVGRYFDAEFNSHGFVLDHGRYRTVDFPGAIENHHSRHRWGGAADRELPRRAGL
jgi:hypothetical protein